MTTPPLDRARRPIRARISGRHREPAPPDEFERDLLARVHALYLADKEDQW